MSQLILRHTLKPKCSLPWLIYALVNLLALNTNSQTGKNSTNYLYFKLFAFILNYFDTPFTLYVISLLLNCDLYYNTLQIVFILFWFYILVLTVPKQVSLSANLSVRELTISWFGGSASTFDLIILRTEFNTTVFYVSKPYLFYVQVPA